MPTLSPSPSDPILANLTQTHANFAHNLLAWARDFGRHDLPWQPKQAGRDPYAVWVSEIMLQQTQVASAIGYYNRFMARFGTLEQLAAAPLDDVLAHWAGLGYYARARNLHKAAQMLAPIVAKSGYPQTLDKWTALPGIGRTTGGAILAMGIGTFGVILDGNVKRVLARQFALKSPVTDRQTDALLWEIATFLTPQTTAHYTQSGDYAQAIMDLGATLCTKSAPACARCPVAASCAAFLHGNPAHYPIKAAKKPKLTRHAIAPLIRAPSGATLWQQRSSDGIWGGLWSLPLVITDASGTPLDGAQRSAKSNKLGAQSGALWDFLCDELKLDLNIAPINIAHKDLSGSQCNHPSSDLNSTLNRTTADAPITLRHTFTHFHFELTLLPIHLTNSQAQKLTRVLPDFATGRANNNACAHYAWQSTTNALGMPAAMAKLLALLTQATDDKSRQNRLKPDGKQMPLF